MMTDDRSSRQEVTTWLPERLKESEVEECTFYELRLPPTVEERGGDDENLLEAVRLAHFQRRPQDSFVETLLEVGANKGLASALLGAATYHQSLAQNVRKHEISVRDLSTDTLDDLCRELQSNCMLIFSSRVITRAGEMHVPMLDFKIPQDANNDRTANEVGAFLGGGTLLSSGSSYHFYGARLLNTGSFERWLLKCQLLNKYVDGRWVTHQLLEKQAALRISRNRAGQRPYVLDTLRSR